uniref:MHC class I-like antigen recognition-like domain-containing protein n=1 Tax=Podarcis muralis TaxID=64176 RepID=A0A670HMM4_PODMU
GRAFSRPLLHGLLLLLLVFISCSTSHSLRYFYTAVSEPGRGLPQFISVGYVDDQQFVQYDSDSKEMLPRIPWMRKVEKEDPQYWHTQTQKAQGHELWYRRNLQNLWNRYNQSGGEWKAGEKQRQEFLDFWSCLRRSQLPRQRSPPTPWHSVEREAFLRSTNGLGYGGVRVANTWLK